MYITNCMTQVIARVPDEIVEGLDALVAEGAYESRSDAVREAIAQLVDRHRRAEIGVGIVDGYLRVPQSDDELRAVERVAREMIEEEPW